MSTFIGGDAEDAEPVLGFSAGGLLRGAVRGMEVEAELLLSRRGAAISQSRSYSSSGEAHTLVREETDTLLYLEMPVLVRSSGRVGYAFGGFSLNFLLSGTYDYHYVDTNTDTGEVVSRWEDGDIGGASEFGLGLVLGAGARFLYASVDVRLTLGLTSMDTESDVRNMALGVMVGYYF
jgi:hypothetical protein